MIKLDNNDVTFLASEVAKQLLAYTSAGTIYGIPRGGIPAAYRVMSFLPDTFIMVERVEDATIVVDDIIDSGATVARLQEINSEAAYCALVSKLPNQVCGMETKDWVVFPWENSEEGSIEDSVVRMLQFIGEDPKREGLLETPARVTKAWREWFDGYGKSAKDILKVFKDGSEGCGDEIVLVSNLPVYSKCEHHNADIFGLAHIGYIPNGAIVGLSKFQRLLDMYAHRLQVQERLTSQVADALVENLNPLAVGVVLECRHMCMESRGIATRGAITVTSALRGAFKAEDSARAEFMSLVRGASRVASV